MLLAERTILVDCRCRCSRLEQEGRLSQQGGIFGCEGDERNGRVMDVLCIEVPYPTAIIGHTNLKQGERLYSTLIFLLDPGGVIKHVRRQNLGQSEPHGPRHDRDAPRSNNFC